MMYTTESINKTMNLCREEMVKRDLSPVLRQLIEQLFLILTNPSDEDTLRNSSMHPSRVPGFRTQGKPKSQRPSGGQPTQGYTPLQPVKNADRIVSIEMKPEDVPSGNHKVDYEVARYSTLSSKRPCRCL